MLSDLLILAAELSGVAMILIFAESLRWSRLKVSSENLRKFVHIMTGLWVALWPVLDISKRVVVAGVVAMIAVNIILKYPVPGRGIARIIYKFITGAKTSKSVFSLVRRSGHGEVTYGLGLLVSAVFAKDTKTFVASVLILTIADGLAAVIGTKYGKHKIPFFCNGKKSYEGSAMFFLTALIILFSLSNSTTLQSLALALALTIIELSSRFGEDNLLLPVAVVFTSFLLGR
jgi:phytol kinase